MGQQRKCFKILIKREREGGVWVFYIYKREREGGGWVYEGEKCDVDMGNVAEAPVAAAAAGVRWPRPSNWESMSKK